jgi:hypothetical protein
MLVVLLLAASAEIISLPTPAVAITASDGEDLAYISSIGDELYIQNIQTENDQWEIFTLPERYTFIDRLFVRNDLCYVLSSRNLIRCDLRSNRTHILESNIEDAVMAPFGEFWIRVDFQLTRITAFGSVLSERNMSYIPDYMWLTDDSLSFKFPIPVWLSAFESDILPEGIDDPIELIESSPPSRIALTDKELYILIDTDSVLLLRK